jgi:hypothetical protein
MLWWTSLLLALVLIYVVRRQIEPHTVIAAIAIGLIFLEVNLSLYEMGAMADIGHPTSENYSCEVADSL